MNVLGKVYNQTYVTLINVHYSSFLVSFVNLDTPKSDEVATGNVKEIACLIQFILGAAVNCDNKKIGRAHV